VSARHVRVTVRQASARPWWVLPVPHMSGLLAMPVMILWLEIAACWYVVIGGGFLLYLCAKGVIMLAALLSQLTFERRMERKFQETQPEPEPQPEPEMPSVHDSVVEGLPASIRGDFQSGA